MTPGPNKILQTPLTATLVKVLTIMSGNSFGARCWTDGKVEAMMLPDQPCLRVVPGTGEMFWTEECEPVGQEEPWTGDNKYADVPYAEAPAIEDYERALSGNLAASPEKERYVRLRLWWAANDSVRQGNTATPHWPGHRDNLVRLLALFTVSDPYQRLLAAEACRQLGAFARAAELLASDFPQNYQRAVNRIRTLNDQCDQAVSQLS